MTSPNTSFPPGVRVHSGSHFGATVATRCNTRGLLPTAGKLLLLQIALVAVPLFESHAQAPTPTSATRPAERSPGQSDAASLDLLKGQLLAEEGSRAEALRELALRAEPADGPNARAAADLLFQLLMKQRANSRIAFLGHTGAIRCASFSPDGKRVVTGSSDGRARVWNALSGEPLTNPTVYHSTIFNVRFSADGTQLLTASADGVAELLNASTGQRLPPAMRQKNSVLTATFSPDGNHILTASADGTARLWDAHTSLASELFSVRVTGSFRPPSRMQATALSPRPGITPPTSGTHATANPLHRRSSTQMQSTGLSSARTAAHASLQPRATTGPRLGGTDRPTCHAAAQGRR